MIKNGQFMKFNGNANGHLRVYGNTRKPLITEFGVYIKNENPWFFDYDPGNENNATFWVKNCVVRLEFHLPRNYGLESISLNSYRLAMESLDQPKPIMNPTNPPWTLKDWPVRGISGNPGKTVTKGNYLVLDVDWFLHIKSGPQTPPPAPEDDPKGKTMPVRFWLSLETGEMISCFPLYNNWAASPSGVLGPNPSSWIRYTLHTGNPGEANIPSIEVADPRISMQRADWAPHPAGSNTFGARNRRTLEEDGPAADVGPGQDLDTDGKLTDASLYMPPPAGRTFTLSNGMVDDNRLGLVTSVAELGYVCTGTFSGEEPSLRAGVPWRSLRLQPNADPAGTVPDWALLDLFTVPVETTLAESARGMLYPGANAVGGRVNLNASVEPFGAVREDPLRAVLLNSPKSTVNATRVSAPEAGDLVANLRGKVLSAGTPPGKDYGLGTGYISSGQVVEIEGIADEGEGSEEVLRDLIGLTTPRGNVFTVYAVGQALKQAPNGRLVITAESRKQVMLERQDVPDPATPGTYQGGRIQTVYYRNITP
jgi:hypothetical protein